MTRPLRNNCEVAIIGGGLAGLAAARHAACLGRLVTLFEDSGVFGGQVATVGQVEGLPFPGTFSGQDLAIHLLEEIRQVGVKVVETGIETVATGDRLALTTQDRNRYQPEAIIVASGARLRRLGVPGEEALAGRGVSQCATCDGGFFRDQDVVVVGGGDAAVQEALVLTATSRQVTLVSRSPLRARRESIDRLAGRENINFVWDSEVEEILGDDGVDAVRLRNLKDGRETELACRGVFPFIGTEPRSGFLPRSLRTAAGHIVVDGEFMTSAPGIYAVGAVREHFGGTLLQAMAEGITAAEAAARSLARR